MLDFWTTHAPIGLSTDEFVNMGITRSILLHGAVGATRQNSNLYLDYPLLFVLSAEATRVMSVGGISLSLLFSYLLSGVFVLELYVLLRSLLQTRQATGLAFLLALFGNLLWFRFQVYAPIQMGFVLLTVFVLIVVLHTRLSLVFVASLGLTTAYLPTAVLALAIVAILTSAKLFGFNSRVGISTLAMLGTGLFAWNVFWAFTTFGGLLRLSSFALTGGFPTGNLIQAAGNAFQVPLWAQVVQYGWIVVLDGGAFLLSIASMKSRKDLPWPVVLAIGGLLASILIGVASALSIGVSQWDRALYFTPLFAAPIMAFFVGKHIDQRKLSVLLVVIVLVSFPTFIVQSKSITTTVNHPSDLQIANFVGAHYSTQIQQIVVNNQLLGFLLYYLPLPNAAYLTLGPGSNLIINGSAFLHPGQIFLGSGTVDATYAYLYGTNKTVTFLEGEQAVTARGSLVYDSGQDYLSMPT